MKKRLIVMLIVSIVMFLLIWIIMPEKEEAESASDWETYYTSPSPSPTPTPTCRPVSDLKCVTMPSQKPKSDKPKGETYTITAYCSCSKCYGKWASKQGKVIKGTSGEPLINGSSVAMPDNVPFGTKVEIKGMGTYVVQDRTGSKVANMYGNKIVDIYCSTHQEAVEIAKQERRVRIYD